MARENNSQTHEKVTESINLSPVHQNARCAQCIAAHHTTPKDPCPIGLSGSISTAGLLRGAAARGEQEGWVGCVDCSKCSKLPL